ncbi:hypothetical protein FK545_04155 [Planococcus glaciei]|nr:hypothetical protein FK545_04155 [Planococcus glaciei]
MKERCIAALASSQTSLSLLRSLVFCGNSDGATRAEDPRLSSAKEAAEAGPAESVHLERNALKNGMFLDSLKTIHIICGWFFFSYKNPDIPP